MRKPFENKYQYDPGRLKHNIRIYKVETIKLPDGSSDITDVDYLETKAGVVRRMGASVASDFTQQQIQSGISYFKGDMMFVVRNRTGLNITTDMRLEHNNIIYEIVGFVPQDDPVKYIMIACSKFEDLTT